MTDGVTARQASQCNPDRMAADCRSDSSHNAHRGHTCYRTGTLCYAEDYADEVFSHVEQSLDTALNSVRRCRDRLNANSLNAGR